MPDDPAPSLLSLHGLDSAQQGLRSDARRNRDRIVAAAITMFEQHAAATTVDQVAARANVGKGTVYRCFATREALMEAAAIAQLDELRRTTGQLVESDGPPAKLLAQAVKALLRNRRRGVLIIGLFGRDLPVRARRARAASREPVKVLLERARDAGAVRADINADDLFFLVSAAAAQLTALDTRAVGEWDRACCLVLTALGMEPELAHHYVGGASARIRS